MNWNIIYTFLTGPALWFTFIFLIGGLLVRIGVLFRLSLKKDRIVYNHISLGWGLQSILQWLIPGGSASMRQQPVFTVAAFVFHLSLLIVPLFLSAHILLWEEAFDIMAKVMKNGLLDTGSLMPDFVNRLSDGDEKPRCPFLHS